ncbi:stage II sporulation protein R [Bacillus sp. 1NLA3E]|uniref:stage II sporulation protein R n=1 Tax=Bacillus sp. 1NLA3E TaxID=666686 RepID=UPI000247F241|nr:stage II sporulation protein R [Bacillus sp. 1NLA3E]AGK56044.1 stage II sporulation protein R [Bacillus sp. 1NLA3E]
MKKKLISSYLILLSLATIFNLYIPKNEVTAKEDVVIPNEAIRLRILANSDSKHDQQLKRKVRDAVNLEITKWVQDLTSIEEARTVIKGHLPEIQKIAEQVVADENETQAVTATFGKVQFPTKLYGQFLYPAGEYEAILITLGDGKGANWWCVLFPPLCFLDFSNGVAVSDGFDEKKKDHTSSKTTTEEKTKPTAKPQTKEKITNNTEVKNEKTKEGKIDPKTEKQQKQTNTAAKATDENQQVVTKTETNTADQKPVYTEKDEDDVEVKFFVKELWTKLF